MTMRRIAVVLGVCALAAASAAIAASGGSAKVTHARLHLMVLPRVRHVVIPSDQGQTCLVSSGQECSLTPCRGFVAGSAGGTVVTRSPGRIIVAGGADWVPITPRCRGQRQRPMVAVRPRGLQLLMRAYQHLPRLAIRPH